MKKLWDIFWHEPAVALGVLGAAGLIGLKFATGGSITPQDMVELLAPFAAALGIRQVVTPARPQREQASVPVPQPG